MPSWHPLTDRVVYLAFDADAQSNRNSRRGYTVGQHADDGIPGEADRLRSLARGGTDGLDDILGGHLQENRQRILLRMIENAAWDRIRCPARKPDRASTDFFDDYGKFLPVQMWDYLQELTLWRSLGRSAPKRR